MAGTVLDDGTTRMEFVVTAADSGGELHEMRVTYQPDSPFPPPHLHPAQDERFEVIDGEVLFLIDGQERLLRAGQSIDIPCGCVHQLRNPGQAPATVIWQVRPALRTAEFFLDITAARDKGDIDELLRVVAEYGDVFQLAEQPSR